MDHSDDNNDFRVRLNLQIAETALRGIDINDLESIFEEVSMQREQDVGKQVVVEVTVLP